MRSIASDVISSTASLCVAYGNCSAIQNPLKPHPRASSRNAGQFTSPASRGTKPSEDSPLAAGNLEMDLLHPLPQNSHPLFGESEERHVAGVQQHSAPLAGGFIDQPSQFERLAGTCSTPVLPRSSAAVRRRTVPVAAGVERPLPCSFIVHLIGLGSHIFPTYPGMTSTPGQPRVATISSPRLTVSIPRARSEGESEVNVYCSGAISRVGKAMPPAARSPEWSAVPDRALRGSGFRPESPGTTAPRRIGQCAPGRRCACTRPACG